MLTAPNLIGFDWLMHGFGLRDSQYPGPITTLYQIHSATVIEAVGEGGDKIAEGDAIVTRQPGMLVAVRTADCVPILIVDGRTRAVASVHAGWRGTAQNIVNAAVAELGARYGSRPEDLHAAVGPAIGGCCYEVGPEVARRFGTWNPDLAQAEGPVHIDLASICETQLRAAGVGDVWVAAECTFCQPERFFSFRREKERAGRMISFAGVKKAE